MKKTLRCHLDTETLQGIMNPMRAYNIAGIIHDLTGNVVAAFNFLVAELYDQIRYDDYAKANFAKYQQMINEGSVTLVPTVEDAVMMIDKLLTFYGVTEVCAYNANFDLVRGACSALMENRIIVDTWLNAIETICQKKAYRDFCVKHGFVNRRSGVCKTSAEVVYAFLTNNPDYAEEHTAMEDSKIEMEIYLACLKTHKKMTKGACTFDDGMKGAVKWPRP